jgi:hypothetical protein
VAKLAGGDGPIDRATLVVSPKLDAQSSMRYPTESAYIASSMSSASSLIPA